MSKTNINLIITLLLKVTFAAISTKMHELYMLNCTVILYLSQHFYTVYLLTVQPLISKIFR
jgi:hypothetical protein